MSSQKFKIIVSRRVKERLGEILRFIASDSVSNAKKVKNELIAAMQSLNELPERAPFLEGEFIPYNKYHKLVVLKRFLIIYQIKENFVYIDYLVDAKQDYSWLIK